MKRRMESAFAKDVQIINLPKTIEDLKRLHHFEFQNWVMEQLFAHVNPTRTGDMGIDGYSIEGTPIQAKQSEDIGRNVVDNFETAIQRKGRKKRHYRGFQFWKRFIRRGGTGQTRTRFGYNIKESSRYVR
jgi:hypothetical protein